MVERDEEFFSSVEKDGGKKDADQDILTESSPVKKEKEPGKWKYWILAILIWFGIPSSVLAFLMVIVWWVLFREPTP